MTLIKDLIEIPEQVQKGDFVLKLTEGVNDAEITLRDYVVTPELKNCFDNGLNFIKSALQGNTSKASYLHGSFGSGKSHFMAVLHLILQGNLQARGIKELASVITKHNSWITGKKFLLVPYHAIGSSNMESCILGGYVDFVRKNHPDAPIPGVYLAESLFQDAQKLLATMGNEAFFAELNEGVSTESGWGELETSWDEEKFNNAIQAEPGTEERSQLISKLIEKFFNSYSDHASNQENAFLSLDKGLSVLSQHAQKLGYDALILFLDELILWLASHATDLNFVHQEGQKLAKLVEAQSSDRPIPIISFVARQRDLSELIGDNIPGAERLNFSDALKHWEGRFHRITLEDRNLPAIAEKRVLKCKSAAAKKELDAAFEKTKNIREGVMNTLLTREGDREMFRKVYPFSLALIQTLIAVSSVLQRERTALKVMMELLVGQRESLTVGDIIPVGDLFDAVAHGEEAFSPEMAIHFENAKKLYHQKLLPLLEKQHDVRWEEVQQLSSIEPKYISFRNDDRLIKTLLLSALVPQVESLREINGERLAALNHGTIKSPIAGREGSLVLQKCKQWAASVGEIRIGEETNPTISLQLSGVDTDSIVKQAEREDNRGNRLRLLREMLYKQLEIKGEDQLEQYREFPWRNTKRSCNVLLSNIRELPENSLENIASSWKLVIDYPFDEPEYSPRDDLSKVQAFKTSHEQGAKTICWLPSFFSTDAEKDLGKLVILEHILTGERFNQYANHLSPQDRQTAKSLLENQRSILRNRVQSHLEAAYGLNNSNSNSLDKSHALEPTEQFISLKPGFELQPPVAANLLGAMDNILEQALTEEFPAAPEFGTEIKASNLEKVYQVVSEAAKTQDGRVEVAKNLRSLVRQIANPLLLGEMGQDATHFVLGHHWKNHFTRKIAESGNTTVKKLLDWLDEPKAMGLPKEAQNLVVLSYAVQTNKSFYLHGRPYDGVSIKEIHSQCELKTQELPETGIWKLAVARAKEIFNIDVSSLLKPSNVANLEDKVKNKAETLLADCKQYISKLQKKLDDLGIDRNCDRVQTATDAFNLIQAICSESSNNIVEILAEVQINTSETAIEDCLNKASKLKTSLERTQWEILESIARRDDLKVEAKTIQQRIQEVLTLDDYVMPLASTLKELQSQAIRLLTQQPPEPKPPIKDPSPVKPKPKANKKIIQQESKECMSLEDLELEIKSLRNKLKKNQQIRFNISWIIEENEQ